MGFREPIRRSTLADANETRDWRIYAELAHRLIVQARKLYANEDLGLELSNTVYALDSTTIDLCLSVFPWAHFRTSKAAVKMHTLLDLRGNIPSFIHISDGKLHDVNVLDLLMPEAGAIYIMDRGYIDFERLYTLHQAGAFFVTRAKSNMVSHRVYSKPTDRETGIICDQTIALDGYQAQRNYPEHLRRIRYKDPETGRMRCSSPTTIFSLPPPFVLCTKIAGKLNFSSSGSSKTCGLSNFTGHRKMLSKLSYGLLSQCTYSWLSYINNLK